MFKITTEAGITRLFYNNEQELRQEGDKSLSEMIDALNGYILSSLTEIPKKIIYIQNNPYIKSEETLDSLNIELSKAQELKSLIDEFKNK